MSSSLTAIPPGFYHPTYSSHPCLGSELPQTNLLRAIPQLLGVYNARLVAPQPNNIPNLVVPPAPVMRGQVGPEIPEFLL